MEDSSEENVLKEDKCDAENCMEWRIIWQGKDKWNQGAVFPYWREKSARDTLGFLNILPGRRTKRENGHEKEIEFVSL